MTKNTVKPRQRRKALTAVEMEQAQRLCRERLLSDLLTEGATTGTPIPSERTLSEQYGIPLSVIRATLGTLKNEGLFTSVPRGGMRLTAKPTLPKTLTNTKIAYVGYMELSHPGYQHTRPAVICAGLERTLNEQGGTLQFYNTWGVNDFHTIVADIERQGIEGILYIGSEHTLPETELGQLAELELPMITIERESNTCDSVVFDNVQIGQTLAEHIIELGHRRVCILEFPEHDWSTARAQSICQAFQRRGLTPPHVIDFSYPANPAEILAMLRTKVSSYTACIATNDSLACMLLTQSKEQGIRVPEQLSVIGVDDLPGWRHFNLTTVQLSDMELGLAAFKHLKEKLLTSEPKKEAFTHFLKCPLIIRGTTAPCPESRKK